MIGANIWRLVLTTAIVEIPSNRFHDEVEKFNTSVNAKGAAVMVSPFT
jgi:hypothetical protein